MPRSLKIIKELSAHNINLSDVMNLHYYDLQSLLYSFRIDDARRYLKSKGEKKLQDNGIDSVRDISGSEILKYMS